MAAEQELFAVAERVGRCEADLAQLDAAEARVRALRQRAEATLGSAVSRLRQRRP